MNSKLLLCLHRVTPSPRLFATPLLQKFCSSSGQEGGSTDELKRTSLYELHRERGATMVEFAGHSMPLVYATHSITQSHNWVRQQCGLFDVSHMLQTRVHGAHRTELVESLTVTDVHALAQDASSLSVFTNAAGGIMDDLIVANCAAQQHIYLVSNAGCAPKIRAHLRKSVEMLQNKGRDVRIEDLSAQNSLIALQGPATHSVLQSLLPKNFDLEALHFGRGAYTDLFLQQPPTRIELCRVTRCGYTGEDGVEISVPHTHARKLADALLSDDRVIPVGLAARDTLRLEAGLCLYGNDIDESTTPVEALLAWTIGKDRRDPSSVIGHRPTFPGFETIKAQLDKSAPISRKRVGFMSASGPPPRNGYELVDPADGEVVGRVTSGCKSPYLGFNIGMGYVNTKYAKQDTELEMLGKNNKKHALRVTKMPFVATNYHTAK